MKKTIILAVITGWIWACLPGFVSAHAYISESSPYENAELESSPSVIRLTFTEKVDAKLSSVTLTNAADGSSVSGKLGSGGDSTLLYTIPKLEKGIYKVSWQVLSLDTHTTDGSYKFAVGVKLGQTKPDDTISLDGDTEADGGAAPPSEPGGGGSPAKPAATAKPVPVRTPAPSAAAPSSSAGGSSTEMPARGDDAGSVRPSPADETGGDGGTGKAGGADAAPSPESADAEALEAESSAAEGGGGIGAETGRDNGAELNRDDFLTAADEAEGEAEASETTGTADTVEAGMDRAHAEGSHEHGGGHGLMIALRILDIFVSASLAGMLFFRYILWRGEEQAPAGFSLRAERAAAAAAALIWILSGWVRFSMLSEQLGGLPFYTLASETMIGKIAVLRPAGALFLLLLAFAPARERLWANRVKWLAIAGVIATFPLTGHAYASVNGAAAAVFSHALHMGAAAIWFGGLAGLLSLTFSRQAADGLNRTAVRFSAWALPCIALMIVSGAWLSFARLSAWSELLSTAYGRLIAAKLGLMLLVLAIAALHKLLLMPKIAEAAAKGIIYGDSRGHAASRRLMFGVRLEVLLAVCLFGLAGWLSSSSPPMEAAGKQGQEPFYWHVMGEQAHMSVRISDESPSRVQQVRLDVWLPEGMGQPAAASMNVAGGAGSSPDIEPVVIPLELQPLEEEKFEFPGFTKYTYRAEGIFERLSSPAMLTVDISDSAGNDFHYEKKLQ
ncbi:copper resistance protein CopC/CopD [Paenibacillus sp. N4]|uniref:copper resistance CopC/CopD family protein n=1 Tax=Paenibacillus vietnamensis TaxID=2590547 RepID=UPI001CD08DB4|nr:CopD family protein [Paenibacillus vietnamensis]MCA0756120.1 copper resistance protein CopC/CopD [Paenibacillus vietnamensis]